MARPEIGGKRRRVTSSADSEIHEVVESTVLSIVVRLRQQRSGHILSTVPTYSLWFQVSADMRDLIFSILFDRQLLAANPSKPVSLETEVLR